LGEHELRSRLAAGATAGLRHAAYSTQKRLSGVPARRNGNNAAAFFHADYPPA